MKVRHLHDQLTDQLNNIQILESKKEAEVLIYTSLKWSKIEYISRLNDALSHEEISRIRANLKRRLKHEPLAYIFNEVEFRNKSYNVDAGVLIPRPETELIIERVIQCIEHEKLTSLVFLECGYGTGVISIELAKTFPNAEVMGWDINPLAYDNAIKNQQLHDVQSIQWIKGDFFSISRDWLRSVSAKKNVIIISNPPYIPENDIPSLDNQIKQYEPHDALNGGIDGLDYYKNILKLSEHIPLRMCVEIGIHQKHSLTQLCQSYDRQNIQFFNDLSEIPRVLMIHH